MSWVMNLSVRDVVQKLRDRVLPNLHHLPRSRVRICLACQKRTFFLAIGRDPEFHVCLRCHANLRYELLAIHLRERFDIPRLDVLELDFASPLRPLLARANTYTPSFYRPDFPLGETRQDGIVCQDVTRLTFPDASLDLIVSSDVLEHVPDLLAAFRETARVLRPGGSHVFTVPTGIKTRQRATVVKGEIIHLAPPDYHRDPLDPIGILAFWDVGEDLPQFFSVEGLEMSIVRRKADRVVWEARKVTEGATMCNRATMRTNGK
jgi:hypothetical protein